jgi:hypothetical protein
MTANSTEVSQEAIARRARELSLSDEGATDEENWYRAERELRGDLSRESSTSAHDASGGQLSA